jgi:YidC/Oxa1 family membrane protein insertase
MERRVIAAVAISIAILVLYPYAMNYIYPPSTETPELQSMEEMGSRVAGTEGLIKPVGTGVAMVEGATKDGIIPAPMVVEPVSEKHFTVDTPLFHAEFSSAGGGIKVWELRNYRTELDKESADIDLATTVGTDRTLSTIFSTDSSSKVITFDSDTGSLSLAGEESGELVLSGMTDEGLRVEKRFIFNANDYAFTTNLKVANATDTHFKGAVKTSFSSALGAKSKYGYHSGPVVATTEEIERISVGDDRAVGSGKVDWLGMEDKYFLGVVMPSIDTPVNWGAEVISDTSSRLAFDVPVSLAPGTSISFATTNYMGPKEYKRLSAGHGEATSLALSIEFGYFSFLAKPLLLALFFLQKLFINYGIAIIILTIVIKIIFYPLTKHSLKSMKDMQKIQPQMAAMKEKYKGDKDKLNKELMAVYKRHKINPLSGCLPMVLQIPVFIGLYEALYVAIELRHAPFLLWIVDLSAKDPYYISPLLMGASMFVQQKMSPTMADPTQAKMMMLMPIIFTVMFLNFPAGLVLYWLVNNLLTIGQQYLIHRAPSSPPPVLPAKA